MMLIVYALGGRRIELDVDKKDTIEVVKQKIEEEIFIPSNMLLLLHEGEQLDDDEKTCEDYGMEDESVIYIVNQ
uniref:Ubiquitin-like domain-containing protein n=1 Tax=Panagrellus redivivus TaxID=6233 RepID=A0A7E4V6A5_PANRE